ncbi:type II toxin-antitoxin system VapC family toxin [Sphingomonas aliaeris]|uniref:Type II toxin-antitoxin system VapC family toxin n=1 Tax=Sphingomonas aliaeris TaxID=2759526 RepID=A0A974S4B4_9SPHN|nr:type II toxin-antitoxin system VapC family toxin [Sphingomonas aliaeris]QQV76915.1 type II toxin-antitoxin system VapC family toxin [Sphingomonas aliaeris]
MRLLLDTHALIWFLLGNTRLSPSAREAIDDDENVVLVSAVSAMEIATKYRIGKLPDMAGIAGRLSTIVPAQGFATLDITVAHADAAGLLPFDHRDPFDRLLIAQAQVEQALLVSNETLFDRFGVRRLW